MESRSLASPMLEAYSTTQHKRIASSPSANRKKLRKGSNHYRTMEIIPAVKNKTNPTRATPSNASVTRATASLLNPYSPKGK